jgi:pimeloyl-ACP methyl ester carboxylesterase
VTDWVEDARAVMDDVGSDSVAVLGVSAGCQIAILFAARYPERTQSLVLYGGAARFLPGEDYPFGQPLEVHEDFWARTAERWGSGWGTTFWCPSARGDPEVRAHFGSHQRMSASPGAGVAYLRAITALDVRHALPMVSAPTLVLHAARDVAVPVEMARYVAERITDASLVELDSADHLIWFSDAIDVMTDEIEDFLSGLPGRGVRGTTAARRRAGVHDRHGR